MSSFAAAADPGFRGGGGGGGTGGCGKGWGEIVGGAAPGRVREGGTPLAPLRGMGSAVSSPIGVWGGAPEANAFCVETPPKVR